MGKNAQRRRKDKEQAAIAAGHAPSQAPAETRRPPWLVWGVPVATVIAVVVVRFGLKSEVGAGAVGMVGLLGWIGALLSGLREEIPPADTSRSAGIDFGTRRP